MTAFLPIVESLAAAVDDAARAQWLLQVPQNILLHDHLAIRAVLVEAAFAEGLQALDAEIAVLSAVRDKRTGSTPQLKRFVQEYARIGLTEIARRGGAGMGDGHVSD